MVHDMSTHENFNRGRKITIGSDRTFGCVFFGIFIVIALLPLQSGVSPHWWALVIAGMLAAAAALCPSILHPLNVVWSRAGFLIGRFVSPIVFGLLFFLVVTPTAVFMRLAKKDPLRLRHDFEAPSYWLDRRPPGPDPSSMRKQF